MVKSVRSRYFLVALAGIALLAAACGGSARLRSLGNNGNGTGGDVAAGGTGTDATSGAAGSVSGATGGANGGAGGVAGGYSSGGGLAGATGGTGGAAAAKGAGNFASDVGVTKDSINLGLINFASATDSLGPAIAEVSEKITEALVQYTNAHGGVAGRRINLQTCDDGGDVSRARACYEQLKSKVFAFVPSETWLTDVIHSELVQDKVPWLSWGWFLSEYQDAWMFPCHANGIGEANAIANWVATALHPKRVGIMYLNVSEDQKAKDEATKVLTQRGIQVVQTIAQEWDSSDESPHVLAMRSANVDFILSFSWPTPVAKFVHDAATQNWAPSLGFAANHLTGDPGYGSIFGDYIKNRMYTITSWEIPGDPAVADDPNIQAFEKIPEQYFGASMLGYHWKYAMGHHISQSAWNCTNILFQAMNKLGANLTRQGLKQTLDAQAWGTWMGVPISFHGFNNSYAFAHEFIYKWMDGGGPGLYDLKRVSPDPIYQGAFGPGATPIG